MLRQQSEGRRGIGSVGDVVGGRQHLVYCSPCFGQTRGFAGWGQARKRECSSCGS